MNQNNLPRGNGHGQPPANPGRVDAWGRPVPAPVVYQPQPVSIYQPGWNGVAPPQIMPGYFPVPMAPPPRWNVPAVPVAPETQWNNPGLDVGRLQPRALQPVAQPYGYNNGNNQYGRQETNINNAANMGDPRNMFNIYQPGNQSQYGGQPGQNNNFARMGDQANMFGLHNQQTGVFRDSDSQYGRQRARHNRVDDLEDEENMLTIYNRHPAVPAQPQVGYDPAWNDHNRNRQVGNDDFGVSLDKRIKVEKPDEGNEDVFVDTSNWYFPISKKPDNSGQQPPKQASPHEWIRHGHSAPDAYPQAGTVVKTEFPPMPGSMHQQDSFGTHLAPPDNSHGNGWNTDIGDWKSLRGSDSASNYNAGMNDMRIILSKPLSREFLGALPRKRTSRGSLVLNQVVQTANGPLHNWDDVNAVIENRGNGGHGDMNQHYTGQEVREDQPVEGQQETKGATESPPLPHCTAWTSKSSGTSGYNSRTLEQAKAAMKYKPIIAEKLAHRFPFKPELKYPYKEVASIFICWEEDMHKFADMIGEMQAIFYHKYGSAIVDVCQIPHKDNVDATVQETANATAQDTAHSIVQARVQKFINDHSHHQTLIIVYYCGGAIRSEAAGIALFPLKNKKIPKRGSAKYPKVFWEAMQSDLEETESDVLIFMDTIGRYGDPPSSRTIYEEDQGKTELLASFEFEDFDLPSTSTGFTRMLINELNARYDKHEVFSAADLHRSMINEHNKPRNKMDDTQVVPFFMKLNGAPHDCSILLKPISWPCQEGGGGDKSAGKAAA